jgi:hypothetical protein
MFPPDWVVFFQITIKAAVVVMVFEFVQKIVPWRVIWALLSSS